MLFLGVWTVGVVIRRLGGASHPRWQPHAAGWRCWQRAGSSSGAPAGVPTPGLCPRLRPPVAPGVLRARVVGDKGRSLRACYHPVPSARKPLIWRFHWSCRPCRPAPIQGSRSHKDRGAVFPPSHVAPRPPHCASPTGTDVMSQNSIWQKLGRGGIGVALLCDL